MNALIAYIDPGTGAIVLQVLVAGILSVGVVFRRYLISPIAGVGRRVKAVFKRSEPTDASGPTGSDAHVDS